MGDIIFFILFFFHTRKEDLHMKLRNEFLVHQNEGETLLVPAGSAEFSGIIKGNATFGEILSLLKNDVTESQIIEALCKEYDASEEIISRDVTKILDSLRQVKALEE